MSEFRHHLYKWSKPFGSVRHWWELVGPVGGVHFHTTISDRFEPSCGMEFHHSRAAGFMTGTAPHHLKCPLIGEPCWHDGTSMYACDTLWPMIESMLRSGDHEAIFRLLEGEYRQHFAALTTQGGKDE